eukprot:CAMPEP_0197583676 /NCGR_PEP_ID=MMETSP1326-20131121/6523_1 /TAXON_ID=1155430 /ORGANISM="Genus nov. species nov., Strain RCC2288" /LENGTH=271 /DNA_ID=CAMNT_0043147931 /DNA_START=70 /DNA_END=882 /DNA_ORIENTATION=-
MAASLAMMPGVVVAGARAAAAAPARARSSSSAISAGLVIVPGSAPTRPLGASAAILPRGATTRRSVGVASFSGPSVVVSRRRGAFVVRAASGDGPAPPEESSPGKPLAGAAFAVGLALFAATSLSGAPTLAALERDAVPLDVALSNGRPTVVEFYADWCEVCKESAPVVFDVERTYGSKVNFVMLNIDNTRWSGEMEQYGVDGIPHLVFLDKAGKSEGMVVGKFPRQALEANVSALSQGAPTLPYGKDALAAGGATPVRVADVVGTPAAAV